MVKSGTIRLASGLFTLNSSDRVSLIDMLGLKYVDKANIFFTMLINLLHNFLQGGQAVRFQPEKPQKCEGHLTDEVHHPAAQTDCSLGDFPVLNN